MDSADGLSDRSDPGHSAGPPHLQLVASPPPRLSGHFLGPLTPSPNLGSQGNILPILTRALSPWWRKKDVHVGGTEHLFRGRRPPPRRHPRSRPLQLPLLLLRPHPLPTLNGIHRLQSKTASSRHPPM